MSDNAKWRYEGVGEILSSGGLTVPKHQREYSWEKENVDELCKDFTAAVANDDDYFIGTIVLTSNTEGHYQVVDGQQRLATTTMILGAIRDIHFSRKEEQLAKSIHSDYLAKYDHEKEENSAKLHLNISDNIYFERLILAEPSQRKANPPAIACASNKRISDAFSLIRTHLNTALKPYPDAQQKQILKDWVKFLKFRAKVIALEVKDSSAAYTMFETLNDRGVKVSKADLVKNYIFGLSTERRLPESVDKWTSMMTCLATVNEDENVIDFLRIYCCLAYGLTREKAVFKTVKDRVKNSAAAVGFVEKLETFSLDYVAMLNPNHIKWKKYPSSTIKALQTLRQFSGTQIYVLMLSVSHYFSPKEADIAFQLFVNWMVRLFVAGQGRIGRVEEDYSNLANAIHNGTIKKASDLSATMNDKLPKDGEFELAFSVAAVGQEVLARYYLHALELQFRIEQKKADLVPHDDTMQVNLEHVLPRNPHKNWPHLDDETAKEYYNRIGNLALLNAATNAKLGNEPFEAKKKELKGSTILLTSSIGAAAKWDTSAIDKRQKLLASLATRTWPLKIAGKK